MQDFLIRSDELTLRFAPPAGERQLAFAKHADNPGRWHSRCKAKLQELLGLMTPAIAPVRPLREMEFRGAKITALVMDAGHGLSIPAYLLRPVDSSNGRFIMAIHGHGEVEPCIGLRDDYHHHFAIRLAQEGYTVLCPELRGFGTLANLSEQAGQHRTYWRWGGYMSYPLATDTLLYGQTMIGQTVEDLLRWEEYLAAEHGCRKLDVVGISYGGDLALTYPVFSERVERIFASGTLGSFSAIFADGRNAPAHCIPGILQWMDRSDIAGLNALQARPMCIHYGELDTPGPDNASAAYNDTVRQSMNELYRIYDAFGVRDAVYQRVSSRMKHEMDIMAVLAFLVLYPAQ